MTQRQQEKGRLSNNRSLKDVTEKWLAGTEVPQGVVDENGKMVPVGGSEEVRRQTWGQYESIIHRLIEPSLGLFLYRGREAGHDAVSVVDPPVVSVEE